MKKYDAIIIGSGQAGNPLATHLAAEGWKVAMIEKDRIGGTCVNYGCTPTKTLVASAKNIYQARRAAEYGFATGDVKVDIAAIMARKNNIVHDSQEANEKNLAKEANIDVIHGEAAFKAANVLKVTNDGENVECTAKHIFINTGLRPVIPHIEGLEQAGYLTSATILELAEVPEHLVIIGSGYIALEFGQMFSRFGSKVTILEKSPRFLSREDEDIADEIQKVLEAEGIKIITGAAIQHIKNLTTGGVQVDIEAAGKTATISASHLLLAAGRTPNTGRLNLAAAGVETDDKGYVKTNDRLVTNIPGIYALGDVKGGPAFTHIAYNDYLVVFKNLLRGADVSIKGRMVPYCIFIDPELGRVGISEDEAKKKGLNYKVATLGMKHVARAVETGEKDGLMKVIADAETKLILGVAILGFGGGELMSLLQMAMMGGITYDQLKETIFAHPTYAEGINRLFMSLDEKGS